ncbi:TPA: Bax inhibitor-1/YccA family protein [Candidatus Woesearchaeota archaeon]|nr:Bax inhibitor-1/YccA family protein [Candidatus Woesearchaeota archaeon]
MKTNNPALKRFARLAEHNTGPVLTVDGVVDKTLMMLLLLIATALGAWYLQSAGYGAVVMVLFFIALIAGLVIALVVSFVPKTAPYLVPVYAALEGVVIGAISLFAESMYPGIVLQAVGLTFGVAAVMLGLYRARIIKVTRGFRIGMLIAIGSIVLIYLISMILGFFGMTIPLIHESGPVGIIFSIIVVAIAAFSLMLDFDFIEQAAQERAPKTLEWFATFGLLVTLVWLYIEILNLLMKTRD